ncbi:uncharacterized protein C8Q71DRAFT_725031 [Rhodofomes roseus]|uniref:Uncharacterized protein n=1 Tax=Rhodofomes roseus TaxID=34475 RepID=A0ABQ8KAA6_9APHY|nr:uncharacterized protein C8Q71DRAFT_725031 [Rhodofomes roseus]KAH9834442.1 hypothetical protein C8Q71DRAFT_725031 [Rhodofomes roseus]
MSADSCTSRQPVAVSAMWNALREVRDDALTRPDWEPELRAAAIALIQSLGHVRCVGGSTRWIRIGAGHRVPVQNRLRYRTRMLPVTHLRSLQTTAPHLAPSWKSGTLSADLAPEPIGAVTLSSLRHGVLLRVTDTRERSEVALNNTVISQRPAPVRLHTTDALREEARDRWKLPLAICWLKENMLDLVVARESDLSAGLAEAIVLRVHPVEAV